MVRCEVVYVLPGEACVVELDFEDRDKYDHFIQWLDDGKSIEIMDDEITIDNIVVITEVDTVFQEDEG